LLCGGCDWSDFFNAGHARGRSAPVTGIPSR
jgi:hypothetical protein